MTNPPPGPGQIGPDEPTEWARPAVPPRGPDQPTQQITRPGSPMDAATQHLPRPEPAAVPGAPEPGEPKRSRLGFLRDPLSMVLVIQMFMLLSGALIIIITKTNPASISKNEVFRSGMIAIVAVYGIAWMAETMFGAHMTEIKGVLGEMVKEYPWAYAIVLLLVSKFVNSQAAALAAIVPVALAIGVDPAYIVASAPACYGYYILPTYPSDLAAIQFDRSGTTHIGRFVINHSFILPGLIGVGVSCVFGWIFAAMYGFL